VTEGVAFSDLLNRVRLQQIDQHFASRHLKLTDVAHLLGYSSLASFSNWYRGRFNETPTAGRRAVRHRASNQ
jgi:AraC-like DNA-binding protein